MTRDTWLPYARLLRLPAVFTAWADILAAHLIATGGALQGGVLASQLAITTCLYWSGMVLNDCFDLEEDRRDRPGRPVPSGAIPVARAWSLGWLLMATGVLLAITAGGWQLTITLLLALAILAYDAILKHYPVGPVAMGLCRGLNWLLGLSVLPLGTESLLLALPMLLYIIAVTTLSRTETGANNRWSVLLCAAGIVLVALSIVLLHALGILTNAWTLIPLALLTMLALSSLARAWQTFTPTQIQSVMRWLLLGIIPLDALLTAAGAPWWAALPVLLLLLPGHWLSRAIAIT